MQFGIDNADATGRPVEYRWLRDVGYSPPDDISQPRPGECQDMTVLARDGETPFMFTVPTPKETPGA